MRFVLLFLTLSCQLMATPSPATKASGTTVGNGGDVVICKKPEALLRGNKIEVLDYYEAFRKGWKINMGNDTHYIKIAQRIIKKIETIDPTRYKIYKSFLDNFLNETMIEYNLSFPELPDEGVIALPGPDCEVKQLALQVIPELPGEKRYFIKREYWDLLDNFSKATLVIHEIVYREGIQHGQVNSRRTRYFTHHLITDKIDTMSTGDYVWLVGKIMRLPLVTYMHNVPLNRENLFTLGGIVFGGEVQFDIRSQDKKHSGNYEIFFTHDTSDFRFNLNAGYRPYVKAYPWKDRFGQYAPPGKYFTFSEVRGPGVGFYRLGTKSCSINDTAGWDPVYSYFHRIKLDPKGRLTKVEGLYNFHADPQNSLPSLYCGSLRIRRAIGDIDFHHNGMPSKLTLARGQKLMHVNGSFNYYPAGQTLYFDVNGKVIQK